jgi:hypothetical protein
MVLLTVGTVGYLPLVLPLLLPGVAVDSAKIARSLFLPGARLRRSAPRLDPALQRAGYVEAYYSRPIDYAYFDGCSTGGRQSPMEGTRYPVDYDGMTKY